VAWKFQELLVDVSESLPKRLRQCADYVAEQQAQDCGVTVAERAEGAGVQPSAFIRFCGNLGFSETQR
jgi:DNA-binding MurR/RpiR family transcriptional regulator